MSRLLPQRQERPSTTTVPSTRRFPVFLQAVPVLLGAVPGLVGVRAELSCQFAMGGEVNTVVDLGELEFGGEVECKVGSTGIPSCGIQNVAFTTRAEAKLSELKLKFGGRFECGPKISADLLVGGLVSFDVNALATVNGCAETAVDLTSLDVGSAFQLDTRAAAWVGGSAGLWWLGQKKWMVTAYDSGCTKLL
jgi:hypothetical protein